MSRHMIFLIGGLVAAVILFWLALVAWDNPWSNSAPSTQTQVSQEAIEPSPVAIRARWLLAGEVFWGRQMERIALGQKEPYKYLFTGLSTLNRDDYDAWLAHMECPITSADISFEQQATALIFNCRPQYLEEFSRWFDAVSLANNHMDNVGGEQGLIETRNNLEKSGVQYYGHFDNSITDDICEVVSLPVRLEYNDGSYQHTAWPVALCGYHNVFKLPTASELAQITKYSKYFFVIASPQQGAEYQPAADEIKAQVYRSMIDSGADMVIASHPHWVQNSEVYKGKLIMYSTGNFMFDQEWSEEVKRGVALDLELEISHDDNLELWLRMDCRKFKDNCLKSATGQNLTKPNFTFTYRLVSVLHENGQTKKAPESIHQLNLSRTNWQKTLVELNQP